MSDLELQQMRTSFEAGLPLRRARASRVKLQSVIPSHWFSAAASECHGMYISGHFYGAISVAQAYVEALSKYLCETYRISGTPKSPANRWTKLHAENIVGPTTRDAALAVFSERNSFHHLNKDVERDYRRLEDRAADCVNLLYTIELDVFAHTFDAGKIVLAHPERWPDVGDGLTHVHLRQNW